MKTLSLFLGLLITFTTFGQENKHENCKPICDIEAEHFDRMNRPAPQSLAINNYDIIYHRCFWEIDPAINYIKGNILTRFKPTVSGFNAIQFDLENSLTVDSVLYHGNSILFGHSGDILQINFNNSLPQNSIDSIQVFYRGVPTGSGFGSFVQSYHGTTPIIWTLSEPYGAMDWWPCKQDLSDKIDSIDIVVECPKAYSVASNGLLHSEVVTGTKKTAVWKHRHPITTYLVAIAVTNYAKYTDVVALSSGDVDVLNYVYPEDSIYWSYYTPLVGEMFRLFDSLSIPYPFADEKYGHAQFGWGGGMEHQTMSFMGSYYYPLMAHELAHQWFGDYITCGSWQDIWLNEGFASYFEGLTVERYNPTSWLPWKQSEVSYITSEPWGSVFCQDTSSSSSIFSGRLSYSKGSYLLHMLRMMMGDDAFFTAIQNYLNDPLLADGFARTGDLKGHLESESGLNLTPFFDQWFYGEGYPSYNVLWYQNGNQMAVTINQSQSHSSVNFFEMPVPIKFVGPGHDTTIVFDHTFDGQVFYANIPFAVNYALFDPEVNLISANNNISIGLEEDGLWPIKVYPNPVSSTLYLEGLPTGISTKDVKVIDIQGKEISTELEITETYGRIQISVGSLTSGQYLVEIHSNGELKTYPFQKL